MRGGEHADLAARRFSALALWCFVAMAASGVVNALVRIRLADLVRTEYGWLIIGKVVALCLLGVLGWRQRRTGVAALQADPRRPRTADPAGAGRGGGVRCDVRHRSRAGPHPAAAAARREPSPVEVAIGYDFAGPADGGTGAVRLAIRPHLRHRGDRLGGGVPGRCGAGCGAAATPGRSAGRWRWLFGCAALLFATSSGLGRYMPAMFSMHMVAHMLLSMLVPILLVLGAPVTLALRALPAAGRGDPPGPAGMAAGGAALAGSRGSSPTRSWRPCCSSRASTACTSAASSTRRSSNHAAHVLMNVHFLLSGYLFYWVVIGVDPTPRQIPQLGKLAMVFASLPLHAFFGVVLMGMQTVLGETFYRSLQLSWHTDLLGDQRLGGGIAWAAGEVPLVVVMIALLIQWRRSDQRTAKRLDRAADRDDDADLAAYNAMLAELARRDTAASPHAAIAAIRGALMYGVCGRRVVR